MCLADYDVIMTCENFEEIVETAIGQFAIVISLIDWLKSPSNSLEFYRSIVFSSAHFSTNQVELVNLERFACRTFSDYWYGSSRANNMSVEDPFFDSRGSRAYPLRIPSN